LFLLSGYLEQEVSCLVFWHSWVDVSRRAVTLLFVDVMQNSRMPKKKKKEEDHKKKYAANHPYSIGTSLIFNTRYVKLTEQVRATDLDHAAVVENLSRGKGISYQSLKSYKVLSEEDYKDPDSLWYEAPIVVTINRERFSLVCAAATRFARSRGTIVLRWKSKHKDFEQRPPEEHMKDVYKDPCFYEYFVAGAECCLNASVNRDLGLVNALPFVMHSLTMPDKETH
jgi:hypothetical protein